MILQYITNTDVNGNSYFLGIDIDKKIFTMVKQRIAYTREDATRTTKTDIRKLVNHLKESGYTETNFI